jgi:hypothetical protein
MSYRVSAASNKLAAPLGSSGYVNLLDYSDAIWMNQGLVCISSYELPIN